MKDPEYLGDGVYAHIDDSGRVVLTTSHHDPEQADDIIVMELPVLSALDRYIAKHGLKNA